MPIMIGLGIKLIALVLSLKQQMGKFLEEAATW